MRPSRRSSQQDTPLSKRFLTWLCSFSIFSSRWFMTVMFVLLMLVILALGKEAYLMYQIQEEILTQQQRIEEFSKENQELEDLLAYLQTDHYRERVARERLGLARTGEQVIAVPEHVPTEQEIKESLLLNTTTTNIQRWWDYFFKPL